MWGNQQFRAYLANTGTASLGLAMQQLLLSWTLVGILELPADQVGLLQGLIGIPAVFLMLLGGARSDSSDPKQLLTFVYFIAPVFPLFLFAATLTDYFNVGTVLVWALGISVVQALSTPAQQAILNRIMVDQVQVGVTAATAVTFVVQVLGILIAGQLDQVGVGTVLVVQGMSFAAAAFVLRYVQAQAPLHPQTSSAVSQIKEGFKAALQDKVIPHVLVINFISTVFNAGSFMTVFPFVVKRVYEGDAFLLSVLMAVFFAGGASANSLLLRFQPLLRPGRVYLVLQLSRIIVLFLVIVKGDLWLLFLATLLWGMNMGVTSNLSRLLVQEIAAPEFRGRILAVFSVSMVGSAPIGAVVLGFLIEQVGTLNALLPAMLVSLLLGTYGIFLSPIWRYQSTLPNRSET